MAGIGDNGGFEKRRNAAGPGVSGRDAGGLRGIAEFLRECAEGQGTPVVRARGADGVDEVVREVEGLLRERVARPPGDPLIVEVQPGSPPRRARPPTSVGRKGLRADAEVVRGAEKMWQKYRRTVDAMEKAASIRPSDVLGEHVTIAHEQLLSAHRVLSERFGVDVEGGSLHQKDRLLFKDPSVDLGHADAVGAFCNAMWSFLTFDDVRVAINRVVARAKDRDDDEETARAACGAAVQVLRSRPMLYGVFALRPDSFAGREGAGLAQVRRTSLILLAGWVLANLKRTKWVSSSGKVAPNRLQEALAELAVKGESTDEVLIRELPAATFDELCRLLEEAKANPERARTKRNLNSLRNEVGKWFTRTIGDESRLRCKGRHVDEEEADAERALTAHQEAVAEDTAMEALNALEAKAALSPQQKEVIQLVLAGRTNPEIAAELGTTKGNVEKQKSEAVRRLREAREATGS